MTTQALCRRLALGAPGLRRLYETIQTKSSRMYGYTLQHGSSQAVVFRELRGFDELPMGLITTTAPGHVRVRTAEEEEAHSCYFGFVPGASSPKSVLHPAHLRIWSAQRASSDNAQNAKTQGAKTPQIQIQMESCPEDPPPDSSAPAFFGIRSCDLKACQSLLRVREASRGPTGDKSRFHHETTTPTLVITATCTQPASTCFCKAMGNGPTSCESDINITECPPVGEHSVDDPEGPPVYVLSAWTPEGEHLLSLLDGFDEITPVTRSLLEREQTVLESSRRALSEFYVSRQPSPPCSEATEQEMEELSLASPSFAQKLFAKAQSPHWTDVAETCLSCGNCTSVCPTCFCTDVSDTLDLSASRSERWQVWDSCFTAGHSYVHGGSIRSSTAARYRQWMLHKLSTWHDQFGESGCVGCGRCTAWCPVGIDFVAMAREMVEQS